LAEAVALTIDEKLLLVASWRRSDWQDTCVFGALFAAGLVLTLFGKHLPQMTDLEQGQLVTLLLGGAALPKAASELWTRINGLRKLAFLAQAYAQKVALAHADTIFERQREARTKV
jgi:hypothetical protein